MDATQAEPPLSPEAREVVELLHAGPAHVIGSDVTLGGAGRVRGRTDDIALGGR